jgi:dTDP-4-dehydrorhamnose 3,5-epimerase
MKFVPTAVEGCYLVELEPFEDERGYFARAWCSDEVAEAGLPPHVAQINMSASVKAGTIRGLHWRPLSSPESKFVRCIVGRVFDVCVDVRPQSSTYLQWVGVELTPSNRLALAVPPGCAHGHQALEAGSEIMYLASASYEPGVEIGARWDDPAFGIDWPLTEDVTLSDRDAEWGSFDAPAKVVTQ